MALSFQSTYYTLILVIIPMAYFGGALVKRLIVVSNLRNRLITGAIISVPIVAMGLVLAQFSALTQNPFEGPLLAVLAFTSAASGGGGVPLLAWVATLIQVLFAKVSDPIALPILVVFSLWMLLPESDSATETKDLNKEAMNEEAVDKLLNSPLPPISNPEPLKTEPTAPEKPRLFGNGKPEIALQIEQVQPKEESLDLRKVAMLQALDRAIQASTEDSK